MYSILRCIETEKTTITLLTVLGLATTGIIYAFATLPPEASIIKTVTAEVESKDTYVRLSMFIPMGDNVAGIPLLEIVYSVTASTGEQIQVSRDQYQVINQGDQIVINYWVRGWLDGKSLGAE
jgi:hypothetical protein